MIDSPCLLIQCLLGSFESFGFGGFDRPTRARNVFAQLLSVQESGVNALLPNRVVVFSECVCHFNFSRFQILRDTEQGRDLFLDFGVNVGRGVDFSLPFGELCLIAASFCKELDRSALNLVLDVVHDTGARFA